MSSTKVMRRQVLKQFASTTALLSTAAISTTCGRDPMTQSSDLIPIIDTHQHLWDLDRFKLSWLGKDSAAVLNRSYRTSEYLAATKNLNVVQAVYMEVDVVPEQHNAEADYVLGLCDKNDNPTVAAVISGRPGESSFAKYMERFANNQNIKGVRQVLHGSTRAGLCLEKQFVQSIQLLGEMGKSYDLCMRPLELTDGARLVDQCPKTRFILDHCGNGPVVPKDRSEFTKWQEGIREIAKRPNVVCKISGIVASAPENWTASDLAPVVNVALEAFGDDRVMFAGDWPVCLMRSSFEQWVNALKLIVKDRSDSFKRKLFHDNAKQFYGLGASKKA